MKCSRILNRRFALLITGLYLCCGSITAQLRYQARLPDTLQRGFYVIPLPPDIIGRCRYHLEDLRIFDSRDREVPYAAWDNPALFAGSRFLEFPILSYKKDTDRQTHLILQSSGSEYVSALVLKLRNTEAERYLSISGSTDGKTWFAIREHFLLDESTRTDGGLLIASIRIPPSVYNYYDVTILGKDVLPPAVIAAGIYQEYKTQEAPLPIPSPVITRRDSSDGTTHLKLHFNADYRMDALRFYISGPSLYYRKVYISLAGQSFSDVAEGFLSSQAKPVELSVSLQGADVSVLIDNGSNPPLKIDSIVAYQSARFVLTYLENAGSYRLVCGDSTLSLPLYDLAYFKDSATGRAIRVMPESVTPFIKGAPDSLIRATGDPREELHRGSRVLLWVTLIAVGAAVVLLVLKLMRQMAARKEK